RALRRGARDHRRPGQRPVPPECAVHPHRRHREDPMSWQVRHEGSPRTIDNLSYEQVVAGLHEGLWEATDEVRGPADPDWVRLESHPRLEEVCLDLEPSGPLTHEEEARLDMNALIDVCLVLLVFFIITTSYAA